MERKISLRVMLSVLQPVAVSWLYGWMDAENQLSNWAVVSGRLLSNWSEYGRAGGRSSYSYVKLHWTWKSPAAAASVIEIETLVAVDLKFFAWTNLQGGPRSREVSLQPLRSDQRCSGRACTQQRGLAEVWLIENDRRYPPHPTPTSFIAR